VCVAVQDVNGNLLTTASNTVSINIAANPGTGVLGGQLSVPSINGIATFNDLQISNEGAGYTLTASATGLIGVTSGVFNVFFADLNGNDMADDWEVAYFGSTNAVAGSATADWDGDGLSNIGEFISGTNPTNKTDRFHLEIQKYNEQSVVTFGAVLARYGGLDRRYALEFCTNLVTGGWSSVPGYDNILGTNQTVVCTNQFTDGAVFFRGRVWLQPQ
jgi:hypothetical protein